jgi:hypothetical protein
MPPLSASLVNILVNRNASAPNATSDALQVICAWPVSGQYGPGSRVLYVLFWILEAFSDTHRYYVLVATCVLARKAVWLKKACLAAALLFPAVAAIHGIVLAAVPTPGESLLAARRSQLTPPGAADMDVYGAFQLCAIGILAAPVTVKVSGTYFNDPGRNAIFVWTILLLAGEVFIRTGDLRLMLPRTSQLNGRVLQDYKYRLYIRRFRERVHIWRDHVQPHLYR